ncbi:hypothetical protein ILUMI_19112, partial [Ignelater luminosus]
MKALKKERKVKRSAFTKSVKNLEKLLAVEEKEWHSIKVTRELIKEYYTAVQVSEEKVYVALQEADADEKVLEEELDVKGDTNCRILKALAQFLGPVQKDTQRPGYRFKRQDFGLNPGYSTGQPEQLLRAWQRSPEYTGGRGKSNNDDPNQSPLEKRLESLLCFLKGEVEGEQRILLGSESFGLRSVVSNGGNKNSNRNRQRHMQKTFEQK